MAERINFKTIDDVTIAGDWVAAPTTIGAVILLHTMRTNRKTWADFQTKLAKRGVASLAIDLRGHGESLQGPGGANLDFKAFSKEEHQTSFYDALGAFDWLKRRGFEPARIAFCGASIGANLSVQMLLEEPRLAGAALLSPGGDYQGTDAVADAGNILPGQALWIAASEGDDRESFEASKKIAAQAVSDRKEFIRLKNAGHGTAILTSHPETAEALADWLRDAFRG